MPAHNSKTAFKTGIAGTAKTAPMHSSNSPAAQQQINSPGIPNLLSQPRAKPRTTFRERAPPSSSIHEHRPRPPRNSPTNNNPSAASTSKPCSLGGYSTTNHPPAEPPKSNGPPQAALSPILRNLRTDASPHLKRPRPAQPPLSTHRAHTLLTKSPQSPTPPKKCEG